MSNDNSVSREAVTRDAQLSDLYAPKAPAADLGNLLGITATVRNTGVVRSGDYDAAIAARAAAQSAPVVAPSTPAVAPAAPSLDLSTARSATGERISDHARLTAETIITYKGMETSLGTLLQLGEVTRDGDGTFRPVAAGASPQQQAETPAPEANPSLDDASEGFLTEATTKAPGETMAAMVSIIGTDGAVSDGTISNLASRMGIEPEAARARVAHVQAAYSLEAATAGAKEAHTTPAVASEAYEHARRSSKVSDLRQLAERHVTTGKPVGYGDVVTEYVATMDQRDPSRILTSVPVAGRTTRWDKASKQVIVTLPNGAEVAWGDAVRQGLINIK